MTHVNALRGWKWCSTHNFKVWISKKVIYYECTFVIVEHLLITFWWVSCVAATRKWWLRCSTHKDAFIINDFLRYPHFSEYDESKLYVSNKYLNFFLRNTICKTYQVSVHDCKIAVWISDCPKKTFLIDL